MTASPPTTPPAIAPTLVLDGAGGDVGVLLVDGEEDDDDGEAEVDDVEDMLVVEFGSSSPAGVCVP